MNTGRLGYHLQSDFPIKLNTSVIFTVSIDQETQTKQYFRSMVKTIIKEVGQNSELTLFLPWKLKENYFSALGAPVSVAEESAKSLCKQWLSDNQASVDLLKKNYGKNFSILFDHVLVNTAAFREQEAVSQNLFNSNSEFRHSVSNLAKNYTKNKLPYPPCFFTEAFFFMKKYLMQQSDLLVLLSRMNFSYEIYPGKARAHAMKIALRRFGEPKNMQFVPLLPADQCSVTVSGVGSYPSAMAYNASNILHN